ncbi:hypothetical protein Slala05_85000 [Streptomyces lavendulae subsp. lavendulae]|nr:hypothetical protein Slala05_85000 [Streptomyces lavendulae subsp. lavendulae]
MDMAEVDAPLPVRRFWGIRKPDVLLGMEPDETGGRMLTAVVDMRGRTGENSQTATAAKAAYRA